ncbi:hypothetical protein WMY93_029960 [Mugilogobius chulae]|uniref:Uncharacterized protein n=1 Tax=Mugilogobius chulae TaxID=88201 RepID=A0AAW0MQS4_9GOBI
MFERLRRRLNAGARVRELEQLLQESEEEKQILQKQLSDREKTVDEAKKLLRQLESKNASLQENVEEVDYQNQRLKVQECELRDLLVTKEEKISSLKQNLAAELEKTSFQKDKLDEELQKMENLEAQLVEKSHKVRYLESDLKLAQKAVKEQLSEIDDLEEKLEQESTLRKDQEAQLQQLSKKDEENVLLRKQLDEAIQKIDDLEAQLTNKSHKIRNLGRDLTLAEKAVREQLIENDNLEEKLEEETALRQNLEAELLKLKEEGERKAEFTETTLENESLQKQLAVQQQKITQLEELVSEKDTGDHILGEELERERDVTQDLESQQMTQDLQKALNAVNEQRLEIENLKEELAYQTKMREDAEDIMRDLLQENGRLEFEFTEARRETEATEEQQLQEMKELEEAKNQTLMMRQSLQQGINVINEQHLEIESLKEELARQTKMREDAEDRMRNILHESERIEFELIEERRETKAIEEQQLQEMTELEEAKHEIENLKEELAYQTKMREDAEDIMRDLLQENGRLEFELTEAREEQQLQEMKELEEAKNQTLMMRQSLQQGINVINEQHLEIESLKEELARQTKMREDAEDRMRNVLQGNGTIGSNNCKKPPRNSKKQSMK